MSMTTTTKGCVAPNIATNTQQTSIAEWRWRKERNRDECVCSRAATRATAAAAAALAQADCLLETSIASEIE